MNTSETLIPISNSKLNMSEKVAVKTFLDSCRKHNVETHERSLKKNGF